MRIYLAGLNETALNGVERGSSNPNYEAVSGLVYPDMLESYHYIQKGQTVSNVRKRGEKIFLDSGAFSMFTQKVEVNLDAYAQFIHTNLDVIETASNLDHIGAGGEQKSYDNQKYLESLGVKIQPVHHARDTDNWLIKWLDEGYDYIFLGGMVPETTKYLTGWLDHIWAKYLTNPDGTARVKVHGFGLTTADLMFRYPWYSVDSTSWVMTAAMGSIYLDLPHKDVKVCISNDSPKMKSQDLHYTTLSAVHKKVITDRIEELGFSIENLQNMYGWRWRFNIEYFRRIANRGITVFKHYPQRGLFD